MLALGHLNRLYCRLPPRPEAPNSRATTPRATNFFVAFGRVPLFFYLLQWPPHT